MPTNEEIERNNAKQNRQVKKFLRYKNAVAGKINHYEGVDNSIKLLDQCYPLGSFEADYVLPERDEKLEGLIEKWNNIRFKSKQDRINASRLLTRITNRVSALGGQLLHWI